jgi:hypothetical protein
MAVGVVTHAASSWTVTGPTSTTIALILLGGVLFFGARTVELMTPRMGERRRDRMYIYAEGLFAAGLTACFLSVVAYFAGVA